MSKDCALCDAGFPLIRGKHTPSQSLGMIPVTPCYRERFHFRGFVVQPLGEEGANGTEKVLVLDGSNRVIEINQSEMWLVNDYAMLDKEFTKE